jgi:plastocyanin
MKLIGGILFLTALGWWSEALAQAIVEGSVALPKFDLQRVPLPHYPGQNIQPDPPEPPTAIVYLEGSFPGVSAPASIPTARMSQRGLQFIPNVLAIRVGTVVEFPNHDDLQHNVFSFSKPKRFDLGRYGKNEKAAEQRFDKPGLVKLNCEVHAHMRGYILVLDSPFFTRTDTNGNFRLENLPLGKYVLKAWVNERVTLERPVELKAGPALRVEFRSGGPGT